MRQTILTMAAVLIAGLFTVSQGAWAGGYGYGKTTEAGSALTTKETMVPTALGHTLDVNQVREVQNILTDKGFYAGEVDGVLGPATTEALGNFQKSEGLAVSGIPDEATLRALAPDAKTQEFFGLAPEFGEKGMEPKLPEGTTKPMERY